MKRTWIYAPLLVLLLTVAGCTTEPETIPEEPKEQTEAPKAEVPAEEPVKVPPKEEPKVIVNTVRDDEIQAAEDAIDRADLAGAETYTPQLFLEANEKLEEAKSFREKDPDNSRGLIKETIAIAEEAYRQSVDQQVDEKVTKLRLLESQLYDLQAEKYAPEDFNIVKDRAERLVEYLNKEDYTDAEKQYKSTLRAMQNLYDTVDNNIRWINILDRDTTTYLEEAEKKEVFKWAPEELEKANYSYSEGISYFNNYKLAESEKALKEAKYWAFHAIRLSEKRERLSQTDSLMMDALEELEKASKNRIMNSDGTISEPSPWEGEQFIKENPTEDTDTEEFDDEGSSLKDYNPDAEVPKGDALIIKGKTVVLGDEQKRSLLEQAIELWKQGVKARSEGKYDIADEYFKQSKAYSEAYNANAVSTEYIVKKGDTLWAIAAMKEHLDNPFLWTKIWRRNSLIIENPDLIFPGQNLIIPPQ